nr:hypothetical protein [uncultured Schaedlerella sp.]
MIPVLEAMCAWGADYLDGAGKGRCAGKESVNEISDKKEW